MIYSPSANHLCKPKDYCCRDNRNLEKDGNPLTVVFVFTEENRKRMAKAATALVIPVVLQVFIVRKEFEMNSVNSAQLSSGPPETQENLVKWSWLVAQFDINYNICLLFLALPSILYVNCHDRWAKAAATSSLKAA